jgi:transcriptional regulator with XRE-family HTH domain
MIAVCHRRPMSTRERRLDRGIRLARQIRLAVGTELRESRIAAGVSQAVLAAATGLSKSQISRIERGLLVTVSIEQLSRMASVLGLDLSVRLFAGAGPLRDEAQLRLLGRFRKGLHPSFRVRSEVPTRIAGDQRAWDLVLDGPTLPFGVEGEMRLRDCQAVQRRILLKARDSSVERVILVVADTRANRAAVREAGMSLSEMFPVPARVALRSLAEGRDPGGWALILL